MNTIKISPETDASIKRIAKKSGCSKTKVVEIIFRGLTDEQITIILVKNYNMMTDKGTIEKDGGEGIKQIDQNEDYDDDDNIPFEDQICEDCGEKNIECSCEDDVIDWDDEDEEEEEEEKLSRQQCVKRRICFGCHKSIEECTCGNLDGFPPLGESNI